MPEGCENVNIGEPIAIVVENKEDIAAFASVTKESLEGGAEPAAPVEPAPTPAAAAPAPAVETPSTPAPATSEGRVFISPLAKTILKNSGATLDLNSIKGTGPQGRIVAADILAAVAAKPAPAAQPVATPAPAAQPVAAPTPVVTATYEDVPVTPMRKVISTRLTESKQTIPHYYVNQNVYVDELLKVGLFIGSDLAPCPSE